MAPIDRRRVKTEHRKKYCFSCVKLSFFMSARTRSFSQKINVRQPKKSPWRPRGSLGTPPKCEVERLTGPEDPSDDSIKFLGLSVFRFWTAKNSTKSHLDDHGVATWSKKQ